MKLLVVEGNPREIWQQREAVGGVPYHKRFQSMLKLLCHEAIVEFAFPADDNILFNDDELKTFDGFLLTGSSLFVNDGTKEVQNQLEFAERLFESGVPIYGSCWGLQVATVVAGGKVGTSLKGREIGITKPILLTEAGKSNPYFKHRKDNFQTLCVHLDEVVEPPKNSTILAANDHSLIQALTFKYKNSNFFGVQYHPEFEVSDMVFILRYMKDTLMAEGLFENNILLEKLSSSTTKNGILPSDISDY